MKMAHFLTATLCGCLALPALAKEGPGFQFNGGRLQVNPVVTTGVFWESDNGNGKDDSGGGWRIQPALSFGYNTRRTNLGLNLFYTYERGFEDKDARDSDSYGVNLSLRQELSRRWNLMVSTSYSRSENDEFYGYDWNKSGVPLIDEDRQENYNFNTALGYRTDKWQASIGAGWSRSKLLDGWKNCSDVYNLSVLGGRAIGPHTYWNASVTMSIDKPDYGNTSESYYLMTGVSGETSARTSYSAMAGVGIYDYSGYYGETDIGPTYNISGAYKLSRRVALSMALSSRYEPEYNGDAKSFYIWSHHLTGAVNFQWTDVLSSRLSVAGMYEQHETPSGTAARSYDRTYVQLSFSTSYKLNDYVSLYGSVSWKEDMYSGDRKDEDEYRMDAGLTFRF